MPSLNKRPHSPYWVANYRKSSGERVKRSTKTSDKKLAWKIATEWEGLEKSGRDQRLVESQCRTVVSDILERATGTPLVFYTAQEWFKEWLAGKEGSTAKRTLEKYRKVADDFLKHLGERAKLPINGITIADVRSFRDSLAEEGRCASTVNQLTRKVLNTPFEAARRHGYLTINPCQGVEALRDTDIVERDAFSIGQLKALLNAAEGDWRGAILAGCFTGLRLGDIAELEWSEIDLKDRVVRVIPNKTRNKRHKPVVIPLAPDFADWLLSQPRGTEKAPVFRSLYGGKSRGRNGLSQQFKRIMGKAEIKGRTLRRAQGKGRNTSSLSFHSLRHTFNSALANAGVEQEVRQKLTGHASSVMNDIYTHHSMQTLQNAMSKLPRISGE